MILLLLLFSVLVAIVDHGIWCRGAVPVLLTGMTCLVFGLDVVCILCGKRQARKSCEKEKEFVRFCFFLGFVGEGLLASPRLPHFGWKVSYVSLKNETARPRDTWNFCCTFGHYHNTTIKSNYFSTISSTTIIPQPYRQSTRVSKQ